MTDERKFRMAELYEAHAQSAVRLAYLLVGDRELAKDIAQEAFVRVFGHFADLRKRDSFEPYLRATIVNLTRKHFKRRGLERLYWARTRANSTPSESPPDIEQQEIVLHALSHVPQRQRAALILRYYDDLSEQQIASILGISEQATRSLVARGRKTLREQLGGVRP
jgi:RNA polymerase sigma factor (sigma-70 family)